MANHKFWRRDDDHGPNPYLKSNYVKAIDLVPVKDPATGAIQWEEDGALPCKRIKSKRPHQYYERDQRAGKTADTFDFSKNDLKDLLDFMKNQT